ncbi:DHA2 family efflux MFS transporter permease subunit [Actinocrispum wychmicini]|uniref:EmrB/QacA subfamily drug resistance transporter n=1 Tax=Actinocrispum wychmicini TaxID=1213861 RepID=A0A4R2JUS5_9PSEU|nr:DHA2 family efflux MFS transporter permease subunit [Actinocrispum wychmicini]TCO60789.1 EmrB/QacA subfamily drug resistance transporter [Actinocrispum wychmicini]
MARKERAAVEPLPKALKILLLIIVLGTFLVQLDATMLGVALNSLRETFHADIPTIQWVTTGYLLSMTMVIPVVGWATDRFGAKTLWLTAIGIFGVASLACSMAWDASSLIAFRVVQGLGGGMLLPLAQAILAQAAGPARLGRVMGAIGIPSVLGVVLGPVLGGTLVTGLDWHWVFYINLPVCLIALVASMRLMPADEPNPQRGAVKLDVVGLLLLSPGLAAAIYGLSLVGKYGGFANATVLTWLIGGLVLIAGFVAWSLRPKSTPLIDLRLLARRGFAGGSLVLFFLGLVMYGISLVAPLYFQQARGWTALHAGLLNLPMGVGTAIALAGAGRFADKVGPRQVALVGAALAAIGVGVFTQVTDTTAQLVLIVGGFVASLGLASLNVAGMTAGFRDVPRPALPRASSSLRIFQQFGGSFGAAVLAVVLQGQMTSAAPTAAGVSSAYANTFWWAVAFLVVAALPALLLPGTPAPTAGEELQKAAVTEEASAS